VSKRRPPPACGHTAQSVIRTALIKFLLDEVRVTGLFALGARVRGNCVSSSGRNNRGELDRGCRTKWASRRVIDLERLGESGVVLRPRPKFFLFKIAVANGDWDSISPNVDRRSHIPPRRTA